MINWFALAATLLTTAAVVTAFVLNRPDALIEALGLAGVVWGLLFIGDKLDPPTT